MKYNLFLDDLRIPEDAYLYTGFRPFLTWKWEIARNYDELVEMINKYGMPQFISFDHDLSTEHYAPVKLWQNKDYNEMFKDISEWMDSQTYVEKTGKDCANWIIEYCLDNNVKLPEYFVHSMNIVGKERTMSILNQFKKHQENESR